MRSIAKENWMRKNPGKTDQDYDAYCIKQQNSINKEIKDREQRKADILSANITCFTLFFIQIFVIPAVVAFIITWFAPVSFFSTWIAMILLMPFIV